MKATLNIQLRYRRANKCFLAQRGNPQSILFMYFPKPIYVSLVH